MEKMQEYIDYIFYEIWCEAPDRDYDIILFNNNADLKEIMVAFHYTEPKGAEFFSKGIQKIFLIFKTLSSDEISHLKSWYQANNSIENICKNEPTFTPATYSDVNRLNADLGAALKAFFPPLYSHDFLSLKALADKIGMIDDHYKEFVRANSRSKCPFCGLYDIDGEYVHTREAYDHYLPKAKYPFSSINLKNLAPICYKCNSGHKGSKDPLHYRNGIRRKAFYAYNPISYTLEIGLRLNSADIENLKPQDINITFGPEGLREELQTWNEVFSIEERYKAKCCSAEAKYWITQILDECGDRSSSEFLSIRLESAQKSPYFDTNFLRKPFLEACAELRIFK
jgi:hypothetical protein